MTLLPVSDYLGDSAALCDAVVRLRGPALMAELGRIAGAVTASPHAQFLPAASHGVMAEAMAVGTDFLQQGGRVARKGRWRRR